MASKIAHRTPGDFDMFGYFGLDILHVKASLKKKSPDCAPLPTKKPNPMNIHLSFFGGKNKNMLTVKVLIY